MKSRSSVRRCGFSLVELLVVIGVIAILVGILIPAVSIAVQRSKEAATASTIRTLETACNAFKANSTLGGALPPSGLTPDNYQVARPTSTLATPGRYNAYDVTGATILVWGLLGADYMGTPGFPDNWPDATHAYFQAVGSPNNGLYAYKADGTPARQRVTPTVERDRMQLPDFDAGGFIIPEAADKSFRLPGACFLDKFGQPILYYRARKGAPNVLSSGLGGVFDMFDNALITGHPSNPGPQFAGLDLGAGPHPVADPNYMVEFLRDPKSPAGRPHNEDSFILWSAGADGLYGTADDIANFTVNR